MRDGDGDRPFDRLRARMLAYAPSSSSIHDFSRHTPSDPESDSDTVADGAGDPGASARSDRRRSHRTGALRNCARSRPQYLVHPVSRQPYRPHYPAGRGEDLRPSSGGLPERLTAGPDNAIWFTDPAGNRIGRLDASGSTVYVPLPTPDSGAAAITTAPDGNLWFTEHKANRIGRVTPLGSVTEYVLPNGGGPAGIAAGVDGNLYFAENRAARIDRITPDGRVDEFAAQFVRGAQWRRHRTDRNIWFTEISGRKVGRLTPGGDTTEFALPVDGRPLGIAAGSDGNIWVTIPSDHALCQIGADGHSSAFFLPATVIPTFLTSGSDGNLWFTEPTGKIGRFSTTGFLTEFSAAETVQPAPSNEEPAANRQLLIGPHLTRARLWPLACFAL